MREIGSLPDRTKNQTVPIHLAQQNSNFLYTKAVCQAY